jgi:phosphatidylcholine synthase
MELERNKAGGVTGDAATELTWAQILGAFGIHLLTASGAAWAFLALLEAVAGRWEGMFLWLGVALFVDGVDGPLARRFKLSEALPRWSGETLDLVVDYVTYVFVPVYAIYACGLLPPVAAMTCCVAILVTSALYFADAGMKTGDNHFRGFPAIWNAAAFYLLLIHPAAWIGVLFIAVLIVMTFLPMPFIHPMRVVQLRTFNLVLLVFWSALAIDSVMHDMTAGPMVTGALCLIGVYIIGGGFISASIRKPV